MRTLAITQNITLDGSVELLGDWFTPQGQGDVADLMAESHRQDAEADAFLCGRQTFTDLRGYWRDLADDTTGVSDYLDAVQKYVVSSTLADPEWDRTQVLSGDPVAAVRELKQQRGRDIVLTGSIRLGHTLIEAGLVPAVRLPGRAGPRSAALPRLLRASAPGARPRDVVHQRRRAARLPSLIWR